MAGFLENRYNPNNVTSVTASSDVFMRNNLALSALVPEDFELGVIPLRPTPEGQARYRIHYGDGYYKDRIDREENKYMGPPGVPVPTPLIRAKEPAEEDKRAIEKFGVGGVEGYKKTKLFVITTGISAL